MGSGEEDRRRWRMKRRGMQREKEERREKGVLCLVSIIYIIVRMLAVGAIRIYLWRVGRAALFLSHKIYLFA